MFIFLLQLRDSLTHHRLYLFTIFVLVVWGLWVWKLLLSRLYRPTTALYSTSTSVIVPVVDEPVELFRTVLARIVEQRPDEVIVVINGAPNPALEEVCSSFGDAVRWEWTPVAGKRNAIAVGTAAATGDVVVLVDSDTLWTADTLVELVKPFAEPGVGGVTTRQAILGHERNLCTRWADWMESLRSEYSMPAMSVLGTVGCLPGRTIAFRRSVLEQAMDRFLNARFLGVFLEVSDDRTLTNEALRQGYRTVYQESSLVYTDAPTNWRKMARQQFRWARGSQYNTLRMLPWMLRHSRTLAVFYACDILLPFLLLGTITGWIFRHLTGADENLYTGLVLEYGTGPGLALIVALTLLGSVLSTAVRQTRHLAKRPSDLYRLPVYLLINTFLLMPIRLLGFVRMAHNAGWGTRKGGFEGEAEPSHHPGAVLPYLLALGLVVAGTAYHA